MESSVSYFEKALNLARLQQDSAIINAIQKVGFIFLSASYWKDVLFTNYHSGFRLLMRWSSSEDVLMSNEGSLNKEHVFKQNQWFKMDWWELETSLLLLLKKTAKQVIFLLSQFKYI